MSEADFRSKRRQQFLTEKYFQLNWRLIRDTIKINSGVSESGLPPDDSAYPAALGSVFKNQLKLFRLEYTAGTDIDTLSPVAGDITHSMRAWFASYSKYLAELGRSANERLRPDISPLKFEDLFDFQQALDAASIGLLLGRGGDVREVSKLLASYRGQDMMFEAIIEPAIDDPTEPDEFFHEEPYGLLVDAVFTAGSPQESATFVKRYLDNWYKAFEGVPWHNGHLVVTDEYSNYEGYWAFDAAAVCVIHGIDDTPFRDHIAYPKDLADWARNHHVMQQIGPDSGDRSTDGLRCEGGQRCPRAGYWITPAQASSRQRFESGELMPRLSTDYGTTIWQWDSHQEP